LRACVSTRPRFSSLEQIQPLHDGFARRWVVARRNRMAAAAP